MTTSDDFGILWEGEDGNRSRQSRPPHVHFRSPRARKLPEYVGWHRLVVVLVVAVLVVLTVYGLGIPY